MRNWLRPRAETRTEKDGSIVLDLEMPGFPGMIWVSR